MIKTIRGKCYVVGDDIDTDQIIPAQYLTYNPAIPEERKVFGRFAMIGLPEKSQGLPHGNIPFVKEGAKKSEYQIMIAGRNFGCGSSREHASICLREAGIQACVAEFYSRIFFRNSVNGGYLIPFETEERLVETVKTGDELEIDLEHHQLKDVSSGKIFRLKPLGEILPILEAGDIFKYAKTKGMA
ncbi:MAG: 3-isopropylmalate dehydratase [Candidatus Omnitrophica bacterium]|nr:3-isopropylmalate dehydratase [Candidatus Omnitrophota bacterium]